MSMEEFDPADFRTPRGVVRSASGNVRSQQRVKAQLFPQGFIKEFDFSVDQHDRQMRIRKHLFDEPVASHGFRVCEPVKKAIALRIIDRMDEIAFLLVTKRFSVADEKLKVACVWLIDVRVINLVDDAVAEREPKTATGVIRSANTFLGAGSPARLDPRSAKRSAMIAVRHLNDYYIARVEAAELINFFLRLKSSRRRIRIISLSQ